MHSSATLHTLLRRLRLLPLSIVLSLLAAGALPVALAAGGATIRDDVGLFTQAGRARINSAASDANLRILVITNKQSFPTRADWQSWLRSQATDPNAITIGLHVLPNEPPGPRRQQIISAVPGANTHLSQAQADQAVADSRNTFNQVGVTAGVVALINEFKAMGATSPDSGGSAGPSLDWLIPVVLLVLAFLAVRLFTSRRRTMPGGYGQPGAPYQGYNQGYGGPGFGGSGGFGRGLLGGLLGGLGGAWLGNQLFGNRGGDGNANAAGYDPNSGTYDPNNSGPTDTPEAQSLQGGWDNSGGAGSGSGWDAGSGDIGGGWDAGGSDSGGGWS